MDIQRLRCHVVSSCVAAAILAACGGGSGTPLSPSAAGLTATRTTGSAKYKTLYSFSGRGKIGASLYAPLIAVNGVLYGTASHGGAQSDGTVFAITTSGKETTLHSFEGYDGVGPLAGLIDMKGTFYGTTIGGGDSGSCGSSSYCGTVFSVTPSGKETVLHNFSAGADGAEPDADLIHVKSTLYSTTLLGGATDGGTVFAITTSGKERVLHSFGGKGDGALPRAGLTDLNGTLYGTTGGGGTSNDGTVFSITTSGNETVLHNFSGGTDGAAPFDDLIDVNGTLYGTTGGGGTSNAGTVFSIKPSGKEAVLYSFKGGKTDGAHPWAGLANVNGTLYGTTVNDGAIGDGTLFSVTLSGKETVLHSFARYEDGQYPYADLLDDNGTLYGTTAYGGVYGYGTVFSLKP
jgi:uncharacterized repeat protein (TIGR03803 family)